MPPGGAAQFLWGTSQDGRYIVFNDASKKLHLLDRATDTEVPLPGIDVDPNPGNLTVSNTGLMGFDSNGNGPLRLYDSVTKAFVQAGYPGDPDNIHRQPELSGDARFLATTCLESGGGTDSCKSNSAEDGDPFVQDLVTKLDTGFPDDLVAAGKTEERPCINGDGRFVGVDIGNPMQRDVFVYDRMAGAKLDLTGMNDPAADDFFCVLDASAEHVGLFNQDLGFRIWKVLEDRFVMLPGDKEFGTKSTFSVPYVPPSSTTGPTPTGPLAGVDIAAPGVEQFGMTRTVFAVARSSTPTLAQRRRRPRGSAFRYALSEPADVTIVLQRYAPGRRVGRRCRKPSRRLRGRRRCNRLVRAGTLVRRARPAGRNSTPFSGRIGRRALRPARYRATLTATDPAGNRSASRRLSFRIVRR